MLDMLKCSCFSICIVGNDSDLKSGPSFSCLVWYGLSAGGDKLRERVENDAALR